MRLEAFSGAARYCRQCTSEYRKGKRTAARLADPNRVPTGFRRCSRCRKVQQLDAFGGGRRYCRPCNAQYAGEQRISKPHLYDARAHRQVLAPYGLTPEGYAKLLAQQSGGCAICGRKALDGLSKRLSVDHCHQTGRVRALLCGPCNRGIGFLGDDPARLRAAAAYLESHGTERSK